MWRALIGGEVFVPAGYLRHVEPWRASYGPEHLPQWNPLMYDSVGQFYPWRKFAADTIHSGYIPLWNPYQFCGTPFIANSQSAVFYPGNTLFYVLPVAQAAGWTALLHLILAASFMYLFMRGLGTFEAGAALSGIAFAFSSWEVSWLHLPTFLATSCWLPLIVHLTRAMFARPTAPVAAALAAAVGFCMLAGHLQIAFYVLFAAFLAAFYLAFGLARTHGTKVAARSLGTWACAVALGGMLAAVQIVPTLELSRRSHRVSPPSMLGYHAYTDYAVSADGLVALLVPDFFNNPSSSRARYFGTTKGGKLFNYAEGAMYVGLFPLALGAFATFKLKSSVFSPFLVILALVALLMALGTAVDAVLYFCVPGFGQSGSPGRALVLWSFAITALAGLGFQNLTTAAKPEARPILLTLGVIGVLAVISIILGLRIRDMFPEVEWDPGLARQAAVMVLSGGVLLLFARKAIRESWRGPIAIVVVAADLVSTGYAFNPTAPAGEVYASTPLIEFLRSNAGHDRIAPINQSWSMAGPQAILPPNGAMALGLRDIQGYDSLFPGQYKTFMNHLSRPAGDSSPVTVGNMVFAKNPQSPLLPLTGTRFVLSREVLDLPGAKESYLDQVHVYELPGSNGRARLEPAGNGSAVDWKQDLATRLTLSVNAPVPATLHLADQFYAGWKAEIDGVGANIERDNDIFRAVQVPVGTHAVSFIYRPASYAFGLFLSLCAATAIAFTFSASRFRGSAYALRRV